MPQASQLRSPLAGIRVLDFTQVIAGPFCTTMLADMGAEVVKVEKRQEGDSLRSVGRYRGREQHEDYFYANNRSKRSIELNLKDPAELEVGLELAARADVVVENYAAGTSDRLGIGYAAVSARNPKIVYCAISGFGQDGPYRNRTALDPIVQAVAGLMSVTGFPGEEPVITGAPVADVIAGMYGAYAVLAALRTVELESVGQFIDISMQAALIAALGPRMGETLQAGIAPARYGNQNPMRVPADTFRTADGRWLAVICHDNNNWRPLCRAVGHPEWAERERFATMAARAALRQEVHGLFAEAFATRTLAEWAQILERERVPYSQVNDYVDALDDPQVAHRRLIHTLAHPVSGDIRVVGPPWQMSATDTCMSPPPLLGEHTDEVLKSWLGWDAPRRAAFAADAGHASGERSREPVRAERSRR